MKDHILMTALFYAVLVMIFFAIGSKVGYPGDNEWKVIVELMN